MKKAGDCSPALVLFNFQLPDYSHWARVSLQEQNIVGKIMIGVHRDTGCCNTCYIGEQEIAISVNGNSFPCSRLVGVGDEPAYVFGNVQQGIDRARQHFIIGLRPPPGEQ